MGCCGAMPSPGAPTITKRAARAAKRSANKPATMPPNEKPTRSQARSPHSICKPCSTGSGNASASLPCGGTAESPKPGKSGTSTWRPDATSAGMLRSQCVQLPLPP